jgi:Xaa-Pro aminopeptidase
VPARDVALAVRRSFEASGTSSAFTSQTGHGIGLGHPEPPFLVEESTDVLQAGEVVTIEPSQFVPGVCGIRLEHNYWIGPEGTERLSHHPFEL